MKLCELYKMMLILESQSDFDKYNELDQYLKQRKEYFDKKLQDQVYNYEIDMFKKYNPEHVETIKKWLDSNNTSDKKNRVPLDVITAERTKVHQSMTPEETDRFYAMTKRWLGSGSSSGTNGLSRKLFQQYMNTLNRLTKKLKIEDPLGLSGDVKSKFAYHLTNPDRLISILDMDEMESNYETGGVSLTTNKNLIKRKPIFYHGSTTYYTLGVQIVFDLQKIKQDGWKLRKGSEERGTHYGEEEVTIKTDDAFNNVRKYIVKVILFGKHIEPQLMSKIVKKLKEFNIPYFINGEVDYTSEKLKERPYSSEVQFD